MRAQNYLAWDAEDDTFMVLDHDRYQRHIIDAQYSNLGFTHTWLIDTSDPDEPKLVPITCVHAEPTADDWADQRYIVQRTDSGEELGSVTANRA
jgi:hypothetical protein